MALSRAARRASCLIAIDGARLEAVFAEALAHAGGARSSYLDRACADDAELRAEVESLLQAHQEDSGFLES